MSERDWRPLSTAPHDGQDVELLRVTGAITVGWWVHDCWDTTGGERLGDKDLKGWRPKGAAF